ncbi:MAG: histidinol-phosphate transaminase [Pseudomonadota bacterium]
MVGQSNTPKPRDCIAKISEFPLAAMIDAPEGAILLNTNESRFGPSPKVYEALRQDPATMALNIYPAAEAYPLNHALAARFGFGEDQVVSVSGGELLIPLAMQAFAAPGREVIYFADGFQKFLNYTLMCDARPVRVDRTRDSVGGILGAVTPATRVVLIDNPGNPTGKLLSPHEIAAIHAGLPRDVLFLLDEAYIEFSDYGDGGLDLARSTHNTLTFRTFSKAYGLAGLRLGWAAGDAALVNAVKRVIPSFPIARPSLAGALAALEDQAHLDWVVGEVRAIRAEATARLAQAGWDVAPSAANFLLIRAGTHHPDAIRKAAVDLRAANILVRLLPNFQGAPAIRMTLGTRADMEQVYRVLGC